MTGRLFRSRDERVLAGVAGGLADYLDVDPSLVRVVWVILALFSGGAFLIVYVVMALVVPEEPWEGVPVPPFASPTPPGTPPPSPVGGEATAGSAAGEAPPQETPPPGAPPTWPGIVPPAGWQGTDWRAQRQAWRAQRRAERAARWARGERPGQAAGLVVGLILLTVGLVFLLPLVFPDFAIGRYWPLILIVLGVLLVIAAVRPSRPSGP